MIMKQVLVTVLAAFLLAVPAAVAADSTASIAVQAKKKTVTVTFKVSMHCQKCVAKLTDNLSFLKGVKDLRISLEEKTVVITYDPSKTNEDTLRKAIEKCGYSAEKVE